MCSTTRRSAASLLSDPGICELGVGGTGHLDRVEGAHSAESPALAPATLAGLGDKLKVLGEAGFIYTVVDTPPAITDTIRAVVALADLC